MKKYLDFFLMMLIAGGCINHAGKNDGKPEILVTILPEKSFIEKIAGNDFDVSVLVPSGANPATYSLLPSHMMDIARAFVWFRMGYVGFELSWKERIMEANRNMKIVDLSSGLDLISRKSGNNQVTRTGVDPHIWLSPQRVKIMALQIKKELILLNPGKAESYNAGYQKFLDEINTTDSVISQILKNNRGKQFITFHPSLGYFAKDYGLIQFSLEEGGKEPAPANLAIITETAKQNNIRAVYIQSEFDKEFVRTFADEIQGKIIQIWPMNPDWSNNLISIAHLLSEN